MIFRGYMIQVNWDTQTLWVRPKNKASRLALLGPNRDATTVGEILDIPDELKLPREQIVGVSFKEPSLLTNGLLKVYASDGKTYQLHFRRKHTQHFRWLYDELGRVAQQR